MSGKMKGMNHAEHKMEHMGHEGHSTSMLHMDNMADMSRHDMSHAGHHHMNMASIGLWRKRLIVAVILSIPMLYFMAVDLMGKIIPFADQVQPYMAPVSFLAATTAMLYLGAGFFHSTIQGLREKTFNMDSLITIGTTVAYVYSWVSYLIYIVSQRTITMQYSLGVPHLYFETVVFLFLFVILGKYLEAKATNQTGQSIRALISLKPHRAHLVNGDNVTDIPTKRIEPGDHLLVKPGEAIPTDGVVYSGSTNIDESMITGESIAVDKHTGNQVIGGTVNGHGSIEMIATTADNNTMLSRIIRMIRQAEMQRAPIEDLSDRIAAVFVPFVIMIALVTFFVWYFIVGVDMSTAMMYFVAIVMIACPCAFGLATPTAVTVGIGQGSRRGILIKGGNTLQELSKVNAIVFDKTGTLTEGKPVVTDIVPISGDATRALTLAASLEKQSEHSMARAILSRAKRTHIETLKVTHFEAIPGRGISGYVEGKKYYIGNERLLTEHLHGQLPDVAKLRKASKSISYLFNKQGVVAVIAIADQPKSSAARTIRTLHKMKIETYLLSGDNTTTVDAIARRLGIKHVISDVAPDQKVSVIRELKQSGKTVAMIGDGINDAPAIATANVGVAIGTGTDAAIEAGDVVLVSGDPYDICRAINLSHATVGKIYQNLFFSMFYNIISIPLAAGALSALGIHLRPELAGLIMALSSVAVVINSLTLKLVRPGKPDIIGILAPTVLFILFSVFYLLFATS